jgi:hypothetical protein
VGVVEIAESTMTIKLNAPGATARPTDFAPADGYLVFALKKETK